ncbi:MAG: sulfotransferase [Deltaproteobacteria bacterium]|nr:sulfotransferase [Deltaproteobacteria bacterium]
MPRKRLPDFIIGGAPRSGTTWLYHLLDRHPDICMANPVTPEPKFFLVDGLYERGIDYYSDKWFSDVPEGEICGEKSANYLESPVAAVRIHKHLPDVRLVFILRNPVDRAFSNYLWSKMNGLEKEDFATALDIEEKRELELPGKLRYARPYAYFSRGLYADLLEPYFSLFPREQILCIRFEDIIICPELLTECLHEFLGVRPRPDDAKGLGVINMADDEDNISMPEEIKERLYKVYEGPNQRLAKLLGPGFELWR